MCRSGRRLKLARVITTLSEVRTCISKILGGISIIKLFVC